MLRHKKIVVRTHRVVGTGAAGPQHIFHCGLADASIDNADLAGLSRSGVLLVHCVAPDLTVTSVPRARAHLVLLAIYQRSLQQFVFSSDTTFALSMKVNAQNSPGQLSLSLYIYRLSFSFLLTDGSGRRSSCRTLSESDSPSAVYQYP